MGGFLPLENDYREIRRQIWLATDQAYKAALESLAEKRAVLQNETRAEDIADFLIGGAVHVLRPGRYRPSAPYGTRRARARPFRGVQGPARDSCSSDVSVSAGNRRTYYLNSEGSSFIRSDPSASIGRRSDHSGHGRNRSERLRRGPGPVLGRHQRPERPGIARCRHGRRSDRPTFRRGASIDTAAPCSSKVRLPRSCSLRCWYPDSWATGYPMPKPTSRGCYR